MKKIFLISILLFLCFFIYAQQSTSQENGFEKYMAEYMGKEIVVTILNVDTNIEGKLVEVYSDGIIIETTLLKQKVFILKNAIAFVKKKFEIKGK